MWLVYRTTKKELANEEIYAQRKQQECRVAEDLRKWSKGKTPQPDPYQPPASQRVTRSRNSSLPGLSPETLIVAQTILYRFKEGRTYFTHLDIQIMFSWHTYQAMEGRTVDPALSLLLACIMIPFATDERLGTRATEILPGSRSSIGDERASEIKEIARLLAADGAGLRMWDTLQQGTIFAFGALNTASSRVLPVVSLESSSTSLSKSGSGESVGQILEGVVIGPPRSSCSEDLADRLQEHVRAQQLEEDKQFRIQRVRDIESEQVKLRELWAMMECKLSALESENRRLKEILHTAASMCTEPWSC
ncbi:hypothetical protein PDE_07855 [Penicillium oxalicum 114-2]|uniref:Uncharacterized protein n=1 Tax=Penicillium oxalicum (strain 114-2 / CGMCC 5302) TaxID=933388 RepID=S7ZR74_PENO1|nr:hypothetical protein PDE_07855 [Penicillium oxalicum 114-2]